MSEKTPQQYLGPADRSRPEPPSAWDMVKEQVMAPQYRESNLTCVFFRLHLFRMLRNAGGRIIDASDCGGDREMGT